MVTPASLPHVEFNDPSALLVMAAVSIHHLAFHWMPCWNKSEIILCFMSHIWWKTACEDEMSKNEVKIKIIAQEKLHVNPKNDKSDLYLFWKRDV